MERLFVRRSNNWVSSEVTVRKSGSGYPRGYCVGLASASFYNIMAHDESDAATQQRFDKLTVQPNSACLVLKSVADSPLFEECSYPSGSISGPTIGVPSVYAARRS
jgi:hypothetical protein